jgi:hypothetical protein
MADLAVTAANVLKSSNGTIAVLTAATAITRGQYIYTLAAGTAGLADSNGTTPANTITGIALADVGTGQPVPYVPTDTALTTGFTASAAGVTVYLSNTPGGATETYADIASGSTVIILGNMTSTTVMKFSPLVGGVKP